MDRSLEQILEGVELDHFDERLKHVHGSIRLVLEGRGTWRLDIDCGRWIARQSDEPADTELAMSPDDFVRIVNGHQNMLTAYMQGRVRVEGDLALAKLFHGLMPGAPEEAHP